MVSSIVLINLFILFYFLWTYDYSNLKDKKYEDYQTRLKLFKKYKDDLEKIVDYFNKNDFSSIVYDYSYQCSVNEQIIKIDNNIYLCTNQKNQEDKLYEIKKTIKKVIIDGKFKKINITRELDSNQKITINFYLMSSLNGEIYYSYCYDDGTCPLKEEFLESKRGKYISNRINNNWFSIYDSIPTI